MADYRRLAQQDAQRSARTYGLDPAQFSQMFMRQINQESGFSPTAHSPAGAIGISQIVPRYHPDVNPNDPVASLSWAADYMGKLTKKYGGPEQALSVYNSGRPDTYKDPNFAHGQTYNYVKAILGGSPAASAKGGKKPGFGTHPSPAAAPGPGNGQAALATYLMSNLSQYGATGQMDSSQGIAPLLAALSQPQGQSVPTPSLVPTAPLQGRTAASKAKPGNLENYRIVQAIKQAQKMGLTVRENTYVGDKIDPVHVNGSYHYRYYPGTKLNEAADISGSSNSMAAYAKWAAANYGKNVSELFYNPVTDLKNGVRIGPVPHHNDHVHIAFGSA